MAVFWKPYGAPPSDAANTPPGMDPALYEYRPPIDLTNPRLRMLAAALGPAYVRSSGTWANATYFPVLTSIDNPGPSPATGEP